MKKTVGICMLAAASALATQAFAATPEAMDSASRWSASSMDRHMPVNAARLQKLGQKKFRYMDMAQAKRSRSLHNAVLVYGADGRSRDVARESGKAAPQAPVYRDRSQAPAPRVIMRPST